MRYIFTRLWRNAIVEEVRGRGHDKIAYSSQRPICAEDRKAQDTAKWRDSVACRLNMSTSRHVPHARHSYAKKRNCHVHHNQPV